jgi:cytochrome c-type biogenesis protein CcmF
MWISLALSIGLLIWRRHSISEAEPPWSVLSREAAFVAANIILSIIVVIVVAITVYPKAYEAIRAQAIALPGREWFDLSAGPILLLLVLFIGVCPVLGWRRSSPKAVGRRVLRPLLASMMAAAAVGISGVGNWYALAAIVCGFPLFTVLLEWARGMKARHATKGDNYLIALPLLIWSNRPRYGGFIVHIGIILITLGVIGSSMYDVEALKTVNTGEVMFVQDYELTYNGLSIEESESKVTATAKVVVSRDGAPVATLHPQNNYWFSAGDYYAEVATRTTPAEDLFVVLADYDMEGPDLGEWAIIRAKVNPLVVWMWVGGGLMLIGGAVAFWPERRGRSLIGGGV